MGCKRNSLCILPFILIIFANTVFAPPAKRNAQYVEQKLKQVRAALRGQKKNIPTAREILLTLAQNHAKDMKPSNICYVYVYLGYIEDLAGNRQEAVGWYEKALTVKGPDIKWIRQLAEVGKNKPVTWIRHLDGGTEPKKSQPTKQSDWKKNIVERIGEAFVTRDRPPDDISPKMNLSKAEHLENFDILWEAIDRNYSFFEHKGIDWQKVKAHYRPKVEATRTTEEFYNLLYEFIRELKDFHSWLCNYREGLTLLRFSPRISTRLIEQKAVVVDVVENSKAYKAGLRPGSIIIEVDGLTVEEKIKKLQPQIRIYSSHQAFLENAYRSLLDGERRSDVTLKFLSPGETLPKIASLTRVQWRAQQPVEPDFPVTKKKFIWYGIHPSDYGYIRILSFNGRMEIADEFDKALEKLKNTPGLIIDIRENTGGFGTAQPRIVGRFLSRRTKVAVSYKKSGPGHTDLTKRDTYFVPTGNWQYTKPIVLITNVVTGSAADLFACYLISTGRPITIGTTTHGNLTGVGVYVVLPCNLVVRVSNGYVCDASGKIIERNGNVPQIHAEPTIADILNGTDSVLERAVRSLQQKR